MKDTYQTIAAPNEPILFKEKNSKFFGYTFPISSEEEVKPIIEILKKEKTDATIGKERKEVDTILSDWLNNCSVGLKQQSFACLAFGLLTFVKEPALLVEPN